MAQRLIPFLLGRGKLSAHIGNTQFRGAQPVLHILQLLRILIRFGGQHGYKFFTFGKFLQTLPEFRI